MLVATAEGIVLRLAGPGSIPAFNALLTTLVTQVVPVMITFCFFFLVYRVVPRRVVTNRHAAGGAILATILWEGAKTAFAYYLRNLARYAGLYGTLEGVIVLAIWLELSVSIILYCGEVVALLLPPKPPPAAVSH
jgi:membrane protein